MFVFGQKRIPGLFKFNRPVVRIDCCSPRGFVVEGLLDKTEVVGGDQHVRCVSGAELMRCNLAACGRGSGDGVFLYHFFDTAHRKTGAFVFSDGNQEKCFFGWIRHDQLPMLQVFRQYFSYFIVKKDRVIFVAFAQDSERAILKTYVLHI